jgi:hypothetical protein
MISAFSKRKAWPLVDYVLDTAYKREQIQRQLEASQQAIKDLSELQYAASAQRHRLDQLLVFETQANVLTALMSKLHVWADLLLQEVHLDPNDDRAVQNYVLPLHKISETIRKLSEMRHSRTTPYLQRALKGDNATNVDIEIQKIYKENARKYDFLNHFHVPTPVQVINDYIVEGNFKETPGVLEYYHDSTRPSNEKVVRISEVLRKAKSPVEKMYIRQSGVMSLLCRFFLHKHKQDSDYDKHKQDSQSQKGEMLLIIDHGDQPKSKPVGQLNNILPNRRIIAEQIVQADPERFQQPFGKGVSTKSKVEYSGSGSGLSSEDEIEQDLELQEDFLSAATAVYRLLYLEGGRKHVFSAIGANDRLSNRTRSKIDSKKSAISSILRTIISSLGRSSQTQKSGGSVETLEQHIVAEADKEWSELIEQSTRLEGFLRMVNELLVKLQYDQQVKPASYERPERPQDVSNQVLAELSRIDGELHSAFGISVDNMMTKMNPTQGEKQEEKQDENGKQE